MPEQTHLSDRERLVLSVIHDTEYPAFRGSPAPRVSPVSYRKLSELLKRVPEPDIREALAGLRILGLVREPTLDELKRMYVPPLSNYWAFYCTPEGIRTARSAKPMTPEQTDDYQSADWLELRHGIRPERLSEKAGDGKVKTKTAPRGWPADSQGGKPRLLYSVGDALEHCKPQKVATKTRRKPVLSNS